MTQAYSSSQRSALWFLPFLFLIATIVLSRHEHYNRKINACYIHRELQKPAPTWIPLGDSQLHNYSVFVMWMGMFVLAMLPQRRAYGIYSLLYASLWFHNAYIAQAPLKALLHDFNCAGRHDMYPNGISGHYCYFVYVSLTIPLLARRRLQANPHASRVLLSIAAALLLLYAVGSVATLYRTFAHGYHSLRQIFLGIACGTLAHSSLERLVYASDSDPPVAAQLLVQLANSFCAFSLYYALWPTETAGVAISVGQVYFHTALYAGLFASLWFMNALGPDEKSADDKA